MNRAIQQALSDMAQAHWQAMENVLRHLVESGVPIEELSITREIGGPNGVEYISHRPPNASKAVPVARVCGELQARDDGSIHYVVTVEPAGWRRLDEGADPGTDFPRVNFPEQPGMLDGLDE